MLYEHRGRAAVDVEWKEWKEPGDVVPSTTGLAKNPDNDILTLYVSCSSTLRSDRLRKKQK